VSVPSRGIIGGKYFYVSIYFYASILVRVSPSIVGWEIGVAVVGVSTRCVVGGKHFCVSIVVGVRPSIVGWDIGLAVVGVSTRVVIGGKHFCVSY
jgi:hypothetical protein